MTRRYAKFKLYSAAGCYILTNIEDVGRAVLSGKERSEEICVEVEYD